MTAVRRSIAPAALALVVAALLAALGHQAAGRSSPPDPSRSLAASATGPMVADRPPGRSLDRPPLDDRRGLGEADGAVPDGTTVFDRSIPAVVNLDPALLDALGRAATAAADEGVTFAVTSGWRSPAYQEQLLREAVSTYGSAAEAARWVAPPTRSAHVSGDAVDLESAAATWLSGHGDAYGLCTVYDNEPWHVELRPDAVDHGCPARYADATHDPRMQP